MDISDIFKLLQANTNDVDDLKKNYRKTTMQYQNEPELLEQINNAYEQILLQGMQFGHVGMALEHNNNTFSPQCTFAMKTIPIHGDANLSHQSAKHSSSSEMIDMFSGFMKVLPDVVENVMEIKQSYQERMPRGSKYKSSNVEITELPDTPDTQIISELTEDKNPPDLIVNCNIGIKTLYTQENHEQNYQYTIISNNVKEIINSTLTIPCKTIVSHSQIEFKNKGDGQETNDGTIHRGKLILKFNIENFDNFTKEDNNIILKLNITFLESIFGFNKSIKYLDEKIIKLNLNTKGKVIRHKDRKHIQNMGLINESSQKGEFIIEYNVDEYKIFNFEDKKDKLKDILTPLDECD